MKQTQTNAACMRKAIRGNWRSAIIALTNRLARKSRGNAGRLARPRLAAVQAATVLAFCAAGVCGLFAAGGFCAPARAAEFQSVLPEGLTRVWIGPDYFGNRWLDWRLHQGRIECLESSAQRPLRTLHLLTYAAGEEPGTLEIAVRTGPIEPASNAPAGNPPAAKPADTWTGLLLGVGGRDVDYRISCLCHQWAWPDGGLVAAVDGTGKAFFRDNTRRGRPLLEPAQTEGDGVVAGTIEDIELKLAAEPTGETYRLTLSAFDHPSGKLLSRTVVERVPAEQLSGNIALVSHLSPSGKGPGYWFRDWRVSGSKLRHYPERAFGPVLCAMYTLSGGTLKMTAQMGALGPDDVQTAELQLATGPDGAWQPASTGTLRNHSYTITFRVEDYQAERDVPYRIAYKLLTGPGETAQTHYYEGTIRREPVDKRSIVVAAFTGHHISAQGLGAWNSSGIWYPHNELVAAVEHHDPDVLFFSGDQIYEGGLAGIVREPVDVACLDYLYHWLRWCWAFRDLARERPCICTPDDHDVYHGNIFGCGGKKAVGPHRPASDNGGYIMDPVFVNAVHATQTSHLPDPADPRPIEQDISVYFTEMRYAGVSFAIIADRMFKSSPTLAVPEGRCVNGWFQNPGFDPATQADVPGAVLLGERQLRFLDGWADDWSDRTWMKVLLSQTIFANVATLPKEAAGDGVVPRLRYAEPGEYLTGDQLAADADSNGWPQTGRNKALRAVRRGFAFHIAGDQHLGSFIQYGVDDWHDAPYALCVPSVANLWPRRWFPPYPGKNPRPDQPPYAGDYLDGFGNHMTVYAVSNPCKFGIEPAGLYDRAPGYGIVRFDRRSRKITVECWPRWADPSKPDARQYRGWPMVVDQLDNYGRKPAGWLPEIRVRGMSDPVVQVIDQAGGETVYTIRIQGTSFRPHVFKEGTYTLRVGEPGTPRGKTIRNIPSSPDKDQPQIDVEL